MVIKRVVKERENMSKKFVIQICMDSKLFVSFSVSISRDTVLIG